MKTDFQMAERPHLGLLLALQGSMAQRRSVIQVVRVIIAESHVPWED